MKRLCLCAIAVLSTAGCAINGIKPDRQSVPLSTAIESLRTELATAREACRNRQTPECKGNLVLSEATVSLAITHIAETTSGGAGNIGVVKVEVGGKLNRTDQSTITIKFSSPSFAAPNTAITELCKKKDGTIDPTCGGEPTKATPQR